MVEKSGHSYNMDELQEMQHLTQSMRSTTTLGAPNRQLVWLCAVYLQKHPVPTSACIMDHPLSNGTLSLPQGDGVDPVRRQAYRGCLTLCTHTQVGLWLWYIQCIHHPVHHGLQDLCTGHGVIHTCMYEN